ncbi:SOCS box domain-containing protein [Ditylenchus destructor]|uniref:SOCS box domain-containing protein n=1 Tax=Ditylenchus destructor TaxID=166010 RepID=A0AAD4NB16_9BILA|nr:SOCS box domain-containing protein [Ditylenchus destructor]
MTKLRKEQWYWGTITSMHACRLLRGNPPGTFLIRDSQSENFIFSISYVAHDGKVYHSRLSRFQGHFCLGGPNALIKSSSLIDFVEKTMDTSRDERHQLRILMHPSNMETIETIEMKYPLRRNQFMPSLKHLCRITIRHSIRDITQIQQLPVPGKLKKYLSSSTYMLVNE